MTDARTPLLLLPGLMNDQRVWQPVLDAFAASRAVIVAPTHLAESVQAMAASAIPLAPAGPFAVAGFSLGGYVAQEICRRVPDRIAGLALLDSGARAETAEGQQARRRLIEAASAGADAEPAATGAGFDALAAAFLGRAVHPAHVGDPTLRARLRDMARQVGARGFARQQAAAMSRPDSLATLRAVRVPSLVLCGQQDQTTPMHLSEEMAAALTDAELVVVPECGHMSTLEQPRAVVEAMARWLARTDRHARAEA